MDQGERLNRLTEKVIGAAMGVHCAPGPGLLESAYEACLAAELTGLGLTVERQKPLPVLHRETRLDCDYRLDLVVEGQVIVDVKAVRQPAPIHDAQLLSCPRLSECRAGLPVNFNVLKLIDGIRRLVNGFPDPQRVSATSAVDNPSKEEA